MVVRVTENGHKTFSIRVRVKNKQGRNGKQVRVNLGRYPSIGLAEARKRAGDVLEMAEKGTDPRPRRTLSSASNAVEKVMRLAWLNPGQTPKV